MSDDVDIGIYSDSRRLISYEAALSLIQESPVFGTGIGDIRDEINLYYDEHYPTVDKANLQPHNQYLFTAAAIGIPGAIILFLFNILLIIRHIRLKNWLLVAFNLILIFSFLVEDTLEMQIGVAFYFFFNYLGWAPEKPSTS
jgi:O-antigen ligase